MKKIFTVEGNNGATYDIELAATAATFLHYKNQFGGDGFADMKKMVVDNGGDDYDIDTGAFYGLLWSLAYSANKKIKPVDEWLDQFDVAPAEFISQMLPAVAEMLTANAETKEKEKN